MTGGLGGPLPPFLAKARDAGDAIGKCVQLFRFGKRRDAAIEAQAAYVDFEREAKADWEAHNRLKYSLAEWVASHPEILKLANGTQAALGRTWIEQQKAEQEE